MERVRGIKIPVIFEFFDTGKFKDLSKVQKI